MLRLYIHFFCFFFQADDGIRYGHVTGVQTCALPILLVALYGMSRAAEAAEEAGHFCLNVLAEDQQDLADRFGTPASPLIGLLSGLEITRTVQGDAVLDGSLAHFAIRIEQAVDAATHRLLIGPVTEMGEGRASAGPAVRFAGEKHDLR